MGNSLGRRPVQRVRTPTLVIACVAWLGLAALASASDPRDGSGVGVEQAASEIRGRVLDSEGRPISGASVRVLRQDLSMRNRDWNPIYHYQHYLHQ